MCWRQKHTSIKKTVQDCFKFSFHSNCLLKYLTHLHACPYCNDMTMTSPTSTTEGTIATGMDIASDMSICKEIYTTKDPSKTPNTMMNTNHHRDTGMNADHPTTTPINTTAHPQQSKTDGVREESVKKRQLLQDNQAEKMKKQHAEESQTTWEGSKGWEHSYSPC